MGQLPFKVLPELLAKGEGYYADKETVNLGAAPAKKDKRTLRVRELLGSMSWLILLRHIDVPTVGPSNR